MKIKFIVILVALLISTINYAQIDRSKAPKGGATPEIKFPKAKTFKLKNGLTVILLENRKLPTVYFSLNIDIPPLMENNKVGYLDMMGSLMKNTKKYTKEQLMEESEYLGIDLSSSYSGVSMFAMKKHYKKGLELMSEVLLHPKFKQEELDKDRKRMLTALKANENNPGTIFNRVSNVMLYGKNHPYSEYITEKTLNNITIEDFKAFHKDYFKPNHSYMIVIGDITQREVKRALNKYFGKWKKGKMSKEKFKTPINANKIEISFVNLESAAQAHIGVFNLHHLKIIDQDLFMARLANKILGGGATGRLYLNLREDKSWTYGAYSSLSTADILIGKFSATTQTRNEVADSAAVEILSELKKITSSNITKEELNMVKTEAFGNMIMSLEKTSTIAGFKFNEIKYKLPKGFYKNYLKNINKVTVKDIRKNIGKYIKPNNVRVLIVGKGSVIIPKLEEWGYKINYLDKYGNPTEKPKFTKKVPKGITAGKIIDKYIQKIGGEKALKNIETIRKKEEMSMKEMQVNMEVLTVQSQPNKIKREIKYNGMVVNKMVFDGERGYTITPQGKKDLPENERKLYSLGMFRQSKYTRIMRDKLKMIHIEYMNQKEIYKIEIETAKDSKWFEYYDVQSGLLVKIEKTAKVQDKTITQTIIYSDYKEVGNIKLPYQMKIIAESQVMELRTVKVDINQEVNDKEFE